MTRNIVNTVTGPVPVDQLDMTLMHEHIMAGFSGWEADSLRPGPKRRDCIEIGVDRIEALKDRGIKSMLDPCPNDLGRDVDVMAELSVRTGFQIVCATGFYREQLGGAAYWRFRQLGDFLAGRPDGMVEDMAELFIKELTEGVGDTGIKAGIIKVASGNDCISDYERKVMEAAAIAARETNAPITTHTEGGLWGDEQQAILTKNGVLPHNIIIGHSCNNTDHAYHMKIVNGGSYIGFDQLGTGRLFDFEGHVSDEQKIDNLVTLINKGAAPQIVLSQDTVWCWRGQAIAVREPGILKKIEDFSHPTYLIDTLIPQMLSKGITQDHIRTILVDNPRRFFAGDPLPVSH